NDFTASMLPGLGKEGNCLLTCLLGIAGKLLFLVLSSAKALAGFSLEALCSRPCSAGNSGSNTQSSLWALEVAWLGRTWRPRCRTRVPVGCWAWGECLPHTSASRFAICGR